MAANKRSRCRGRPRVALMIESSFASGRGMFCGIAEYVRQHGPWSIYSEPRGLEEPPPAWLADWRGDGIIARLSNRRIAAAVVQSGIPDQVAVIGSGNDETICEFCDPPLSSVVPGYRQVGYEAARLLDRLMRGAVAPSAPLYLKPLGVVTRQSTDVIAVEAPDTAAAIRFIRERACDGVRVRDVAEHCLLARTELKRRFRRFLGRSVLDQIVRDRVKRAAQLLADTELPIAEIARLSGFSSQQRMGVVFRAKLGITPAQYRKQF